MALIGSTIAAGGGSATGANYQASQGAATGAVTPYFSNTTGQYYNSNQERKNASAAYNSASQRAGTMPAGPGSAFTPEMLEGMYQQGLQALTQDESGRQQGIAQSMAARGAAGPNVAAITAPGALAHQRGALAEGNLNAQVQGLNLGNAQYEAQTGRAGEISNAQNQQQALAQNASQFQQTLGNQQSQFGAQLGQGAYQFGINNSSAIRRANGQSPVQSMPGSYANLGGSFM